MADSWYTGPVRVKSKAYVPPSDDAEILLGLYRRISEADDELGVDRQLDELNDPERGLLARNYMLRGRRVRIVKVYTDNDISAYDPRKMRPDFEQMKQDMQNGVINSVGAWAADRIFRQPAEFESFLVTMQLSDGILIATLENENLNVLTGEGEEMFRIKVGLAHAEVKKTVRRQRSKRREQRKSGKYSGGVRRFGFNADMTALIEWEADIIRYCAAEMLRGRSVYSLAKELNSRGIPTVTGKEWKGANLQRVVAAFRNAGLFVDDDGTVKIAEYPAILDRATFTRLQVLVNDPTRSAPGRHVRMSHYLSGFLRCGVCGKSNLRRQEIKSKNRVTWVCASEGGCGKINRDEKHIRDYVVGTILAAYRDQAFVARLLAATSGTDDYDALIADLGVVDAMIQELKDSYWAPRPGMPRPSAADFEKYMKVHSAKRDEIMEKLTAATRKQQVDLDLILAGELDERWASLPMNEQASILKFAARYVVIKPIGKGKWLPPEEQCDIVWADRPEFAMTGTD